MKDPKPPTKPEPRWDDLGFEETLTEDIDLGETLRPDRVTSAPLGPLPRLMSRDDQGPDSDFQLGERLGHGGMGVVYRAVQLCLGREVALKTASPSATSTTVAALIEEARIMGYLEHPNIAPIYAIGVDEHGSPLVAMKRVRGAEWSEYLARTCCFPGQGHPHPPDLYEQGLKWHLDMVEVDDPVSWHLNVLNTVCNAVSFAHSQNIIHRDLKPSNVMVGAFGQVYVLDWGTAVALTDAPPSFIPRASGSVGLVGTPAYMAPEMTWKDGARLSERTDVYLLGAILHEIIANQPPHTGNTLFEVLRSAYLSEPRQFSPQVPPTLAAICNKALARNPEDRFEDVEQLRRAIEDFR